MIAFLKCLIGAAIAYVVIFLLCIWDFTTGIKKSIKKHYNGQI
jgi:hypothetical protein